MSQASLFGDEPFTTPAADARGDGLSDPAGLANAAPGGTEDDVPPFEYWATPVEVGRTLVEASAGTGKTFAFAGLVAGRTLSSCVKKKIN